MTLKISVLVISVISVILTFTHISTGKERQVAVIDITHLRRANSYSSPTVAPQNVDAAFACTCFTLGSIGDGIFMCAALAEKIIILKWNPNIGNFQSRKVRKLHPFNSNPQAFASTYGNHMGPSAQMYTPNLFMHISISLTIRHACIHQ